MLKGTCNLCFFKKLLCKLQIFLICKYKNIFPLKMPRVKRRAFKWLGLQ